jgi:hypothetical protein
VQTLSERCSALRDAHTQLLLTREAELLRRARADAPTA